jgi:hypothetical protein
MSDLFDYPPRVTLGRWQVRAVTERWFLQSRQM